MGSDQPADPRPPALPPSPDPIDADVTDFEELERIGEGGNADVTKQAYAGSGPEVVALKQPRMSGTMDVESVQQFTDEAETWSKLDDHDYVVGVLDYDSDPFPWIALEYMDGGSLTERLGELDPAEALWVGVCVARAVRHAHRHGVAHLDLKPDNVLFRETDDPSWDVPKVSDWGLAKMLLEHPQSVEGITPQYAAPEQFDGGTFGPPDDHTDIYATGAVVYAALTGEPPFTGASTSVMQGILTEDPTPPSESAPEVPPGTDAVLARALAKDKDDRYESILDLRRNLETLVERALGGSTEGTLDADSVGPSAGSSALRESQSLPPSEKGGSEERSQQREGTAAVEAAEAPPEGSDGLDRRKLLKYGSGLAVLGAGGVGVWQAFLGGPDGPAGTAEAFIEALDDGEQDSAREHLSPDSPMGDHLATIVGTWAELDADVQESVLVSRADVDSSETPGRWEDFAVGSGGRIGQEVIPEEPSNAQERAGVEVVFEQAIRPEGEWHSTGLPFRRPYSAGASSVEPYDRASLQVQVREFSSLPVIVLKQNDEWGVFYFRVGGI